MEAENKTIYYIVGGIIIIGGLIYWFQSGSGSSITTTVDPTATTTGAAMTATDTNATSTAGTDTTSTTGTTQVKSIPGYPASWPSDVPKYPVEKVTYSGAHNIGNIKVQNAVVFDTPGSALNVRSFYLNGLAANGWAIPETGNGLANLITLKATKGKRTVIVYINRTGTITNVTVGANIGI